jgi:hypothetical protein
VLHREPPLERVGGDLDELDFAAAAMLTQARRDDGGRQGAPHTYAVRALKSAAVLSSQGYKQYGNIRKANGYLGATRTD